MTTWIGLFRGINVGGNNLLPMPELRENLESLGFKNVASYIQSGNVVFDAPKGTAASLTRKILQQIEKQHGFQPHLLLLRPSDLRNAVEANPFPEARSEPKTLHFFFLASPPRKPDFPKLSVAQSVREKFHLTDEVFYLLAPEGIGRSKLASTAEKHLGVVTTARNYRTVEKLMTMIS
ncbi:MAG: DUF1697 domain-containing protein [Verrucomicrobiota bacterium]